MNAIHRLITTTLAAHCLLISSCASVKQAGQSSLAMVRHTSAATASTLSSFSLASLLPGSSIRIVKAREHDLKDLPTGRERALAYQQSKRSGFWIFGGAVDFKEPTLPTHSSEPDGSLLPPKMQ